MLQQPKKWPGVVAGIVLVIWLYHNPTSAAHVVSKSVHAITQFANHLNIK